MCLVLSWFSWDGTTVVSRCLLSVCVQFTLLAFVKPMTVRKAAVWIVPSLTPIFQLFQYDCI